MKKISIGYEEIYEDRIFHSHFFKRARSKKLENRRSIIKNEHLVKSDYEAEPPLFLFSGSLD